MSWSVNASGNPSDVKKALKDSFDHAKKSTLSVEAEHREVELAEQISNIALDQMIESGYSEVVVSGFGSGSNDGPDTPEGPNKKMWKARTSFSLVISPTIE